MINMPKIILIEYSLMLLQSTYYLEIKRVATLDWKSFISFTYLKINVFRNHMKQCPINMIFVMVDVLDKFYKVNGTSMVCLGRAQKLDEYWDPTRENQVSYHILMTRCPCQLMHTSTNLWVLKSMIGQTASRLLNFSFADDRSRSCDFGRVAP